MAATRTLPDFENPPAVETLMGVHFAPIENWQSPYFGLFWSRIKKDYPRCEIKLPVVMGPTVDIAAAQFQSGFELPTRCWFINHDETRLIQLQSNLFLHNWRKVGLPTSTCTMTISTRFSRKNGRDFRISWKTRNSEPQASRFAKLRM